MTDTKPSPWAIRILAHGSEPAGELLPNDSNWRRHSPAQQRALGAAIGQVGLVAEVIVNLRSAESWGDKRDVKVLVDGHLRAALALLQGESTELPVGYVDLAPDEERLVLASLDPIGAMATADQAKLSELLAALDSQDDQVRGLLEQIARQQHVELPVAGGLLDPDEVPEPPTDSISRPGDLWLLGLHRLLCGDSTEAATVERLMASERAVAMITDPPYLTNYRADNHPQSFANRPETKDKHWDDYIDYESSVAFYADFLQVALEGALWGATGHLPVVRHAARPDRLCRLGAGRLAPPIGSSFWHKSRPVLGRCSTSCSTTSARCTAGSRASGPIVTVARRPTRPVVWEISLSDDVETASAPNIPASKPLPTRDAPDHLAHRTGRAALRALQRQWHLPDRRRATRPQMLRA